MRFMLVLLTALQAATAQPRPELSALTVPAADLDGVCELTANNSEPLGGQRVRSGFWGPVSIPSNPWFGSDPARVARIGEIVVGPESAPRVPDGPPLDASGIADLRRQLFEGVKGYAAAYRAGDNLTFVYAIQADRLDAGPLSGIVAQRPTDSTNQVVIRTKGLWVRMVGSRGPCFDLARRRVERTLADDLPQK